MPPACFAAAIFMKLSVCAKASVDEDKAPIGDDIIFSLYDYLLNIDSVYIYKNNRAGKSAFL